MQYIGSFLFVWAPVPIAGISGSRYTIYIAAFFYPLQGVLNALIYSDMFGKLIKGSCARLSSSVRASFRSSSSLISTSISAWKRVSHGTLNSTVDDDDGGEKVDTLDSNDDDDDKEDGDDGENNMAEP